MKAVIVDIQKKYAAALDENGQVQRIRNADFEIGQRVDLREVRKVRTPISFKRLSVCAAAAALAVMIGVGTAYAVPYGTVTLDGDTAIEYTINCFDYVLDVRAVNEQGESLLAELDARQLRHHRIGAAVDTTVDRMEQRGDFAQGEIDIHIDADTKNREHSENLREELAPAAERGQRPAEPAEIDPRESEPAASPVPEQADDMVPNESSPSADTLRQEIDPARQDSAIENRVSADEEVLPDSPAPESEDDRSGSLPETGGSGEPGSAVPQDSPVPDNKSFPESGDSGITGGSGEMGGPVQ